MIRGDKVAVAHLQSVTAIRVVNRKEAKLLVPILIEGAGRNKKSTPNGVLFLILLVKLIVMLRQLPVGGVVLKHMICCSLSF